MNILPEYDKNYPKKSLCPVPTVLGNIPVLNFNSHFYSYFSLCSSFKLYFLLHHCVLHGSLRGYLCWQVFLCFCGWIHICASPIIAVSHLIPWRVLLSMYSFTWIINLNIFFPKNCQTSLKVEVFCARHILPSHPCTLVKRANGTNWAKNLTNEISSVSPQIY